MASHFLGWECLQARHEIPWPSIICLQTPQTLAFLKTLFLKLCRLAVNSSGWASGGVVPRGDGAAGWVPNSASSARPGRPPGSRPPQGPLEAARAIAAARAGPAVTWPRRPNNAAVPGGRPHRAPLGPLPAGQVDPDDQTLGAAGPECSRGLQARVGGPSPGSCTTGLFLHSFIRRYSNFSREQNLPAACSLQSSRGLAYTKQKRRTGKALEASKAL